MFIKANSTYTFLACLALGYSGVASAAPGDMSRHSVCASFARYAVQHENNAKAGGCQQLPSKFLGDEGKYYQWCMNTSDADFRGRSAQALGVEKQLKEFCAKQKATTTSGYQPYTPSQQQPLKQTQPTTNGNWGQQPIKPTQTNWSQPQAFGNWQVGAMSENGQFQGCVAALQSGSGMLLVGKFMANKETRINRGDWVLILPKVAGVPGNARFQANQQVGARAPATVWVESEGDGTPFIRLVYGAGIFGVEIDSYRIWLSNQGLSWMTSGNRAATDAVTRCFNDSAR